MFTTANSIVETTKFSNSWDVANNAVTVPTPLFNNQTQKSIKDLFYNGTGHYIEDEVEPGLNDLQTLLLACLGTLIPLVISLLTAFGIRVLWSKYKKKKDNSQYDGILERKESQSRPLHSHLLNSDKQKCEETHLAINTEEVEVCDSTGVSQMRSNNHSNTNGSIITMTLKNNHLIVETEERNDIEEDSRETTLKYSPSARDGVFVVEVQQGVRRSPGASSQAGPDPELAVSVSDQCALVHNPPERYSDDDEIEECDTYNPEPSTVRDTFDSLTSDIKTGLTQSNSSLTGEHHTYCYTNQQCYDNGNYGYFLYSGYVNDEPVPALKDKNKPKITAAIYKNFSFSRTLEEPDEDEVQQEQKRLGNSVHILNRQNDISLDETLNEDTASTEYENKGFN